MPDHGARGVDFAEVEDFAFGVGRAEAGARLYGRESERDVVACPDARDILPRAVFVDRLVCICIGSLEKQGNDDCRENHFL